MLFFLYRGVPVVPRLDGTAGWTLSTTPASCRVRGYGKLASASLSWVYGGTSPFDQADYISKARLLFVQFRFTYFTGYPCPHTYTTVFTKLANGLKRWLAPNSPDPHKRLQHKTAALFIPFPFALIESLWLLLTGKNVV